MKQIRRGQIWFVRLDPAEVKETRKTRACLVLQNDIGNQYSETITIAPFLTSGNYPFIVNVTATSQNGLDKTRGLNLSKIRSVSRARFNNLIGSMETKYWHEIERALLVQCGFINS
jgi:mRNA interferase MazF